LIKKHKLYFEHFPQIGKARFMQSYVMPLRSLLFKEALDVGLICKSVQPKGNPFTLPGFSCFENFSHLPKNHTPLAWSNVRISYQLDRV
jgi:hypothetical protein